MTVRLRAERDENTCRKNFMPTEEHALYEALLELERPKAAERQRELGRTHGAPPSNFDEGVTGRAREQAAAGASGKAGRRTTLDKVGEVKRVAQSPDTPDPVRRVAEQALREMDRSGRVHGRAPGKLSQGQPSRAREQAAAGALGTTPSGNFPEGVWRVPSPPQSLRGRPVRPGRGQIGSAKFSGPTGRSRSARNRHFRKCLARPASWPLLAPG